MITDILRIIGLKSEPSQQKKPLSASDYVDRDSNDVNNSSMTMDVNKTYGKQRAEQHISVHHGVHDAVIHDQLIDEVMDEHYDEMIYGCHPVPAYASMSAIVQRVNAMHTSAWTAVKSAHVVICRIARTHTTKQPLMWVMNAMRRTAVASTRYSMMTTI